ncbi:glycoside hydrolase family 99-like domain-containing protein [Fibrobacter sp. HC4]|uniref:glycosyltransferase WbsX family protein n=1 Tax=Fibrobacter sp. HC4 TaxID=3239812 RepID=UPI0020194470|nr:glycoside hydrolase family 99-like domain-containing protein [Fibrobacter succinogenes]MCQ2100820.1 glycoside hydrolase family 99-like domain-containing protein [Fibrobacter sp.]
MKPNILAFYLPQFHPFKENDEWWGKGFTEWTNVGKAKPLFKGHNQPRVPTELGYYDLRLPEIREQQAQMARDAGVTAFCYWHYWLGNGKRLIPEVFDEVLASGKPDFPFCLGWANHSWFAKNWNADGSTTEKLLAEQTYPGIGDAKMHFDYLLKAFKDPRYVKIDGKPILYIFRPKEVPQLYIDHFKKWAVDAGFPGLMLVGELRGFEDRSKVLASGFDAVSYQRLTEIPVDKQMFPGQLLAKKLFRRLNRMIHGLPPRMEDYSKVYSRLLSPLEKESDVIPFLLPQWDHSPRSGRNGTIFTNATPDAFYKHAKQALDLIKDKPENRKILFLKSWNEWGEGNMMEPDLTYGRGFIEALRRAIDETL